MRVNANPNERSVVVEFPGTTITLVEEVNGEISIVFDGERSVCFYTKRGDRKAETVKEDRKPLTDLEYVVNREVAVAHFGKLVVYEAESYYETDIGKDFWEQLNVEERLAHIRSAENFLSTQQTTAGM